MKTIIDTSILISFAKINYLDIILKTKKGLFIPTEVYQESVIEGENRNLPDATLIKRFEEGISFRDAAKTAGLDYWDFQMELDKRGIPIMRSLHLAQKKS